MLISYRFLWIFFTIALVSFGNLVKAANTPGNYGTYFVFALPAVSHACNPYYKPWISFCFANSENASLSNSIHDEEPIEQLGDIEMSLADDKQASRNLGSGICNQGKWMQYGGPTALNAQFGNDRLKSPYGEGTLVYPVDTLGTNYITNGANQQSCSITATRDSTTVTLIFPNNTSVDFRLNKWQVLAFPVDTTTFGMKIKANQAISVSMGNDCANQGSDSKCAYLWEQAVPVENFGTDYIFVDPSLRKSSSYPTKICLVNGGNDVVKVNISGITDTGPIVLTPGRKVQVDANDLTHKIRADGPIDVQILPSFSSSDASQIGLIPNHQFANEACFQSPSKDSNVILVALTSDVKNPKNTLVLNDRLFDLGQFKPTVDSTYSFATISSLSGRNSMFSTFGFGGYIVAYQKGPSFGDSSSFGAAIARNLHRNTD